MALDILLPFLLLAISTAAGNNILQNPDFESPPTNMTSNSTVPFLLLPKVNTIPGWSFNGTVRYITSGPNISLPGNNGHGIQLGKGGKINQTFRANDFYMQYLLTFSLAPGNNKNCLNKTVAVNVSAPGGSKVFSLQRRYGKETWESLAYWLGLGLTKKDLLYIEIRSASLDFDSDDTCSPIVDTFIIKGIRAIVSEGDNNGNRIYNGGFESGPAFPTNSTEGILLDGGDFAVSTIDQWSLIGIVKYINTKYYSVPEGKAAIELVSDFPSGIQITAFALGVGSKYTLGFTIGDANNSCLGEFIIYAQVGDKIQNITMISNGTGSAKNYSMTFKAKELKAVIRFASLKQSKTRDNVLCGPVIDNVILRSSSYGGLGRSSFLLPCVVFMITLLLSIT